MNHLRTLASVALAGLFPLAATAQTTASDSLTTEIELALPGIDSSLAATLPENFINYLMQIITASLEAAAEGMEAAAEDLERELNVDVVTHSEDRKVIVVSGANDRELVELDERLVLIEGGDTMVISSLNGDPDTPVTASEPEKTPALRTSTTSTCWGCVKAGSIGHWKGMGVGTVLLTGRPDAASFDGMELLDAPYDLETANVWSSWNVQVNPVEHRQRLFVDAIGLTTGVGLDWWRINVAPQTRLFVNDAQELVLGRDTAFNVTRNHLSLGYLRVPLLLSLRTRSDVQDALHVEVGVVGGVRLFGNYMRKYEDDDSKYVDQIKGFHMNPLQLNGRITAGYGWFSIFAEVPFRPLFLLDGVETIYPVTVGVRYDVGD